jgi:hypothetical protein
MFRFDPVSYSDDADTSLGDLLSRSGTLLHVGARNCLHVRTKSAMARDALLRSLRVVDEPEALDPTAWPETDEHAAAHAADDDEWGWADDPEVLKRWLEVDEDTLVVRQAEGHPILVAAHGGLCVSLISVYQSWESDWNSGSSFLDLGSLPDGRLISVGSGADLGNTLEVLQTGQSQSDSAADWLRDNILDTRFLLQAVHSDLDHSDIALLMSASTGFVVEKTRFDVQMPDGQVAAIVNRLSEIEQMLGALRTAVEEAESESGQRLRAVLLRLGHDFDGAYNELKEWFPLM